jgi:hypothetical protein
MVNIAMSEEKTNMSLLVRAQSDDRSIHGVLAFGQRDAGLRHDS